MLDPVIKDRISILEPDYAEFVKSDFATEAADQFGAPENFSPDQTEVLTNAIILFLIFLLDFDSFIRFIETECDVDETIATNIAGAVLSSLPDGFILTHSEAVTQLNSLDTTPNDPAILPTPETEIVHSSTQTDLLNN